MDCDRFEATLIDELYEELDELTSAAAKRHVAGCSRCASLIGGLRATRRVAVLPMVEPSIDLEDRILAAARNAQRVVPIGRRLSRAVSWAGSWAMRPQTAMAAVFVLMVGSSLLFVRRSKVVAGDAASNMTVTAQGAPAPAGQASAAANDEQGVSLDSKLAAAAHGTGPMSTPAAAPLATAAPSASGFSTMDGELALKDDSRRALPRPSAPMAGFGSGAEAYSRNAEAPAGAPPAPPPAYAQQAKPHAVAKNGSDDPFVPSDLDKGQGGGGPTGQQAQAPGDALAAARGVRTAQGCGAAVSSYEQVRLQAKGTSVGDTATFEAAQCYQQMGQTDRAQQLYVSLQTVPQFVERANQGIASIRQSQNQVATKAPARAAAPSKKAAVIVDQTQTPSVAAPTTPPQQSTPSPPQQNAPSPPPQKAPAQQGF
jgi:hypothetical protein